MRVLVTGGCGFIGSHQVVELLDAGHEVCVVDDLSNSSLSVLEKIAVITGRKPEFHNLNVLDTDALTEVARVFRADSIIHFAGFKHVPESMAKALDYHNTNVGGLLSVLMMARRLSITKIVFSSSGSVYGETDQLPIVETHPHRPSNPYSSTKSICERLLADVCASDSSMSAMALRYFNPAGAHPSAEIGEDPVGLPSNLVPALIRAAATGAGVELNGNDFNTADGSGVRDYVHVVDVAAMHLRALDWLHQNQGFMALNVGRGQGVSVLEMVAAVERATGRTLDVRLSPRRPGDVSSLYGDTSLSQDVLGPIIYRSVDEICRDAWRWQMADFDRTPEPAADHVGP